MDLSFDIGKRLPEGAEPIATAYAGHQFGSFVPQLGDGRAVLDARLTGDVLGARAHCALPPGYRCRGQSGYDG